MAKQEVKFSKGAVLHRAGGGYLLQINSDRVCFAEPWTLDEMKELADALNEFIHKVEGEIPIEVNFEYCSQNPAGTSHNFNTRYGEPTRCTWCGKWSNKI